MHGFELYSLSHFNRDGGYLNGKKGFIFSSTGYNVVRSKKLHISELGCYKEETKTIVRHLDRDIYGEVNDRDKALSKY